MSGTVVLRQADEPLFLLFEHWVDRGLASAQAFHL